jgi:uncharacterized protein YndB with AHSA1/START domain
MASAEWIHGKGPSHGRESGRHLQNVIHEFYHGQEPFVRRHVPELKPNERIRYSDKFDDPNMAGEMQTTITLKKVSSGTELNIVQEGVPAFIPAETCYLGWQESLTLLAKLVEAEIPDQI